MKKIMIVEDEAVIALRLEQRLTEMGYDVTGMSEYFDYAGYGSENPYNFNFFTQMTDNLGFTYGFTFDDYVAEIDAGRVVMIHVEGHSMFGYGYDLDGNIVYLRPKTFHIDIFAVDQKKYRQCRFTFAGKVI